MDSKLLSENQTFIKLISETQDVSIGFNEICFIKVEEIENAQIGYSISENGESFIGKNAGDWKEKWIVIATDGLGDPIFVDCEDENLPVFSSQIGQGEWKETKIASTFTKFMEIINDLNKLSVGRENPLEYEQNPITENEKAIFIEKTERNNSDVEIWFWECFLDNDDE